MKSRPGTPRSVLLSAAIHKLEWSSTGEWSASIKPQECAALLAELRRPPSKRSVNRKGSK